MQNEIVAHNDLKIRVQEGFFTPVESIKLLENFIDALPWESMKIKMFGRDVVIPRLQCWIGDEVAITAILVKSFIDKVGPMNY